MAHIHDTPKQLQPAGSWDQTKLRSRRTTELPPASRYVKLRGSPKQHIDLPLEIWISYPWEVRIGSIPARCNTFPVRVEESRSPDARSPCPSPPRALEK